MLPFACLPACLCRPSYSISYSLSSSFFPSLSAWLSVCLSRCLALCCFSPLTIYICSLSILMKIFWKCAIFLLRHTIYGRKRGEKQNGKKNAKKIAECSWQKNVHEWRSCSWESLTIWDQFGSEWLRSLTACRQLRSHFYSLVRGRGGVLGGGGATLKLLLHAFKSLALHHHWLWNEKVKLNGSKYRIKFCSRMELQHAEGIIKLHRVEGGSSHCYINVRAEDDLEFIEGFV